jgi:hypothetical protein
MASQYANLALTVDATLTSALALTSAVSHIDYASRVELTPGTTAGKSDMQWSDRRTLAASGTENLDLAGSLTGPIGTTLTFVRIKAVIIKASGSNTNDVQVTRPASNGVPLFMAAGDGIALSPGETFAWFSPTAAGKVVTAATGDLLTITNSAGTTGVTYDVIVIGASA